MCLPVRLTGATRLCACVVVLAAFAPSVRAQGVNDGFAPSLDASYGSTIRTVAVQADGKTLLGGRFLALNCTRLCRLSADGITESVFDAAGSIPNDAVNSITALPSGKILIGGAFSAVGAQSRNGVARLNGDGSLDVGFYDPSVNGGSVNAMVVQPDGKILIGGTFTAIIGQPYRRVARLNSNGTLDTSFADPGVNGAVSSLVVQSNGKVLVGGNFASIGTQVRHHLARLNADGSLDTSLADLAPDSYVTTLAAQSDGKVWVGGYFSGLGGQMRDRIARLNADGSLDASLATPVAINDFVNALALQPDGKIVIGGAFTMVGMQAHNRVARLNGDGSLDASFTDSGTFLDVNGDAGWVYALAVQPSGKTVIGGDFVKIGSTLRSLAARLNADGSLDTGMADLAPDGYVDALAAQPDGRMMVGGYFTQIGGQAHHGAARVKPDGSVDASFADPGFNDTVNAMAVQANGKVLVGGAFTQAGAQARNYLVRLNAQGGLDTDFPDVGANYQVFALAVQTDGRILAGGDFSQIGGQTRNGLARLNADGSLDAGFADAGANGRVGALALLADGKMLVGGTFTAIGGQTRHYLARLNADGSLDAGFADTAADGAVVAIAVQADGKIVVGGAFTQIGGQTRKYIARLNADGSLDAGFADANANFWILTLGVQADGRILVGGGFGQIGGQARAGLARLKTDGGLDAGFANIATTGGAIYALAAQGDGKLLIGGNFAKIQGQTRNALARLSVPDAVLQSLDAQGNAATWYRSGTSPELALPPILHVSANCIDYSAVGGMTRVTGGWQSSDVPLPVGWSCLRAEGRTSSGQGNGSQGLVESVRRVWRDDRIFASEFE